MSKHAIVHVEIPARDIEAAGKFYGELFGWQIEAVPEFNYAMFNPGEGPGGGFPSMESEEFGSAGVLVYVDTDDIDASLAKATGLGAETVTPKTEIPGIGWFGIFRDPSGNRVALFTGTGENGQG